MEETKLQISWYYFHVSFLDANNLCLFFFNLLKLIVFSTSNSKDFTHKGNISFFQIDRTAECEMHVAY